MDKLVIDHSYALGIAWDKTLYRNHGVPHQTQLGSGEYEGSLSFAKGRTAPGSMVVVPTSPILRRMGAVRTRAQVYLNPRGTTPRRHNIVEGHLSFAFAVYPDLSLKGSFLAPDDQWIGVQSRANIFPLRRWNLVEFWYDGVGAAAITLNNQTVASTAVPNALLSRPLAGAVRGIGPLGVFVGHWAALDDRYTFDGYIRRLQVWKRDDDDFRKLMDPCCHPDPKMWDELAKKLADAGFDVVKDGQRVIDELTETGASLFRALTGGDPQRATQLRALLDQYLYAVQQRKNSVPIEPAMHGLCEWIAAHASRDQLQKTVREVPDLVGKIPLDEKDLDDLAKRLCFGELRDKTLAEIQRMSADKTWHERLARFGRGQKAE